MCTFVTQAESIIDWKWNTDQEVDCTGFGGCSWLPHMKLDLQTPLDYEKKLCLFLADTGYISMMFAFVISHDVFSTSTSQMVEETKAQIIKTSQDSQVDCTLFDVHTIYFPYQGNMTSKAVFWLNLFLSHSAGTLQTNFGLLACCTKLASHGRGI